MRSRLQRAYLTAAAASITATSLAVAGIRLSESDSPSETTSDQVAPATAENAPGEAAPVSVPTAPPAATTTDQLSTSSSASRGRPTTPEAAPSVSAPDASTPRAPREPVAPDPAAEPPDPEDTPPASPDPSLLATVVAVADTATNPLPDPVEAPLDNAVAEAAAVVADLGVPMTADAGGPTLAEAMSAAFAAGR